MISGAMVSSWPMVLGCDASGTVVEVGKEAESIFKIGDRVCGCTRLGETGYGTFQEYVRIHFKIERKMRGIKLSDWKHTVPHGCETCDSDPEKTVL